MCRLFSFTYLHGRMYSSCEDQDKNATIYERIIWILLVLIVFEITHWLLVEHINMLVIIFEKKDFSTRSWTKNGSEKKEKL
jgi:hypothetical protein